MKIKTVIDTNVFISSFWGGKPKAVVDLWINGKIIICLSDPILVEYFRVMIEKLQLSKEKIDRLIGLFGEMRNIEKVNPKMHFEVILKDPDDNMFIDCAMEAGANFIISGDDHLLELSKFEEIKIVTPAEFLRIYIRSSKA
ncbi:putative toxin-antitoxin system toxin component, PIN family [candidate division KSB1 bacterium]|nr:putative toxin-antitoxin system toxin component, PIN family [candidate division KSB1 bacterium]